MSIKDEIERILRPDIKPPVEPKRKKTLGDIYSALEAQRVYNPQIPSVARPIMAAPENQQERGTVQALDTAGEMEHGGEMNKYPSTLLVDFKDKTDSKAMQEEVRKADLDLLDKINKIQSIFDAFMGTAGNGPFVPLLPNPLIAGEPSLGTWHTHIEELVNENPGDTADHTVTATNAPDGTTMIAGIASVQESGGSAQHLHIKNMAGVEWTPINNLSTAGTYGFWFEVALDANKQFKWAVDSSAADGVIITMEKYSV